MTALASSSPLRLFLNDVSRKRQVIAAYVRLCLSRRHRLVSGRMEMIVVQEKPPLSWKTLSGHMPEVPPGGLWRCHGISSKTLGIAGIEKQQQLAPLFVTRRGLQMFSHGFVGDQVCLFFRGQQGSVTCAANQDAACCLA